MILLLLMPISTLWHNQPSIASAHNEKSNAPATTQHAATVLTLAIHASMVFINLVPPSADNVCCLVLTVNHACVDVDPAGLITLVTPTLSGRLPRLLTRQMKGPIHLQMHMQ
jgi:hypothetical protein